MKEKRKPNPYARRSIVQTRLDTEELQVFITKAHYGHGGEISEMIREAVRVYKPVRKVSK